MTADDRVREAARDELRSAVYDATGFISMTANDRWDLREAVLAAIKPFHDAEVREAQERALLDAADDVETAYRDQMQPDSVSQTQVIAYLRKRAAAYAAPHEATGQREDQPTEGASDA